MKIDGALFESERTLDLIREIHSNPNITQRYLAKKYAISLGKVIFSLILCLSMVLLRSIVLKTQKIRWDMYIYLPQMVF